MGSLLSDAAIFPGYHLTLPPCVYIALRFLPGPYYCAIGNSLTATNACMKFPSSISMIPLKAYTETCASTGLIDPLSNLARGRVFIFSGTKDSVLVQGVAKKLEDYYASYITSGSIKTVYNIAAEHSMPTDSYGGACGALNKEYINNCNYNGAYEALNHIHGGLQKPSSSAGQSGQLILFDQSEFFNLAPAITYGMDTAGYIYVPTACSNGARRKLLTSLPDMAGTTRWPISTTSSSCILRPEPSPPTPMAAGTGGATPAWSMPQRIPSR
ncbi:poly(3-hydroxybutyrate) depolymerase-like isoform 3-T3 [Anomaloglossus baeobatrachus]